MLTRILIRTVVALTLAAAGCDRDGDPEPSSDEPQAEHAHQEHAAAGVEPGSHEDWCGEHAVPESMCTRCNPALIAAFQATGDWCAEHDRPESQCLICNPDLQIIRPPRRQGSEP